MGILLIDPLLAIILIAVLIRTYLKGPNKITSMRQIIDISKGIYPEGIEPTHDGSQVGAKIRLESGELIPYTVWLKRRKQMT